MPSGHPSSDSIFGLSLVTGQTVEAERPVLEDTAFWPPSHLAHQALTEGALIEGAFVACGLWRTGCTVESVSPVQGCLRRGAISYYRSRGINTRLQVYGAHTHSTLTLIFTLTFTLTSSIHNTMTSYMFVPVFTMPTTVLVPVVPVRPPAMQLVIPVVTVCVPVCSRGCAR